MHQHFTHLAKRVSQVQTALNDVINDVQQQSARETKLLEEVAYGREFNEELTPIQEKIVAAIQEAMESLDRADHELARARETLEDVSNLM